MQELYNINAAIKSPIFLLSVSYLIIVRLPVWPNAKILVIFWLVIPRFNGARIAYNILVRPCLSGQLLQVVLDLLNKNQYLSLEGEPFLVVAQRYVNKHGTEDLEELNSIKVHSNIFFKGFFCG